MPYPSTGGGGGAQGPTGPAGAPGADGIQLEFVSETARDTFFTSNPGDLRAGVPITVNMGADTVAAQIWSGSDQPTSYNPVTDAMFWRAASYEAGTASYKLRQIHSMSSVGENVTWQNLRTDIHWFPAWQGLGDHSTPAGRVVYAPTVRKYSDYAEEDINGPLATSGSVDYTDAFTATRNETVFGIQIVVTEAYNGRLDYTLVDSTDDRILYEDSQDFNVAAGDTLTLWPNCFSEVRTGTQIRASLTKEDGGLLQVRPSSTQPTMPYLSLRRRIFRDVNVIDREAITEVRDMLQELTGTDRLDASAVKDIPDNYVNATTADVASDGTLTITLNRTGTLGDVSDSVQFLGGTNVTLDIDEANDTITINSTGGGGTTPPQADHTNYIDVTADNNASSVDVANAVSSDDLNPTVTLETFTGNRYVQILQSQAHTAFTSIVISGINQFGGFTVNENARTISGQAYRQYVTTNLITDALSGAEVVMGGAT